MLCVLAGIGKTTLVRKVATDLQEKGISLQGFYTEEVRQHGGGGRGGRGGPRIGFDVVSLDGQRGVLARVERYRYHNQHTAYIHSCTSQLVCM